VSVAFHRGGSARPAFLDSVTRAGIALVLAALFSACSTGSLFDSDTPVPANYVLAAAPAPQTSRTPLPVDVSISRPDMAAGLDTDRIAVLKGRELDYYRRVRWGSRSLEVVQNLVVDSLENQQIFRSVTPEQARVAGNYVLDLQVRDFQAEYTPRSDLPNVHVTFVGRLIRVSDRQLVTTVRAEARVDAEDNRMSAVAAAFEAAAHRAILDLGAQVAAAVEGDKAASR
jgi:cholesterol transport system auxiliary component